MASYDIREIQSLSDGKGLHPDDNEGHVDMLHWGEIGCKEMRSESADEYGETPDAAWSALNWFTKTRFPRGTEYIFCTFGWDRRHRSHLCIADGAHHLGVAYYLATKLDIEMTLRARWIEHYIDRRDIIELNKNFISILIHESDISKGQPGFRFCDVLQKANNRNFRGIWFGDSQRAPLFGFRPIMFNRASKNSSRIASILLEEGAFDLGGALFNDSSAL
ncbi:hypothetical protein HF292_010440 [Acidithiobacillus ferruginosus]|uniref:Uncharacterized protein n=1 Tax=Acidithiobacillus ferruginosus TaxID=3063951 RepID=A0ACD5IFH9_9PROT|nr:DUF6685 family protein [Acidithiobacillus ferruginosus]MBU2814746.1 hypothetical protein [Acidithiobacillus ferruginosus]